MTFKWGRQQAQALTAIDQWLKDPKSPQVFRLYGYAGTGKTSLAKHIAANVDGFVPFCAYTGKAARVLQRYGAPNASTIHRLIYKPLIDPITLRCTGFELNTASAASEASLIVVDEVSMVDNPIGMDLTSYKKKILVLGDPMQLPPIRGEGFFTRDPASFMLTDIHRQALDNPIIYMATEIREGRHLPIGRYGESRVTRKDMDLLDYSQVIVGANATRRELNKRIRQLKGIDSFIPVKGEKIVGLKNDHQIGFLNGTLWTVDRVNGQTGGKLVMDLTELNGLDMQVTVSVPSECFTEADVDSDMIWEKYGRSAKHRADFGEALTCHKMQGSQDNKILVYDESYLFGEKQINWRYTAVTRAIDSVTLMR